MIVTAWLDTSRRYGMISRIFHWLMATLFAWQFAGALLYVGIGDTALTRFVGKSHFEIGFALLLLALLRGVWGLLNFRARPRGPGLVGKVASVAHGVIYGLMIAVPGIAVMRQYGSGQMFAPFGILVMPARGHKIEWMSVPADLFHYWLGFFLMTVVLAHVAMALVHKIAWKDDVMSRMA